MTLTSPIPLIPPPWNTRDTSHQDRPKTVVMNKHTQDRRILFLTLLQPARSAGESLPSILYIVLC
jgi:hypothetical protein